MGNIGIKAEDGLLGRAEAPGAGEVGETISDQTTADQNLTTSVYNQIASITLTNGVWLLSGSTQLVRSGATISSAQWSADYSSTGRLPSSNKPVSANVTIGSCTYESISLSPTSCVVVVTDSGITFPDGFNSTSKTVNLEAYPGVFTGGPVYATSAFLQAVRLLA